MLPDDTAATLLICLAIYCQYVLAHHNPYRSSMMVFLFFVFAQFIVFRLNTAHRSHLSTMPNSCWSKWLILLVLFFYLFHSCSNDGAKKNMLKNVFVMMTIFVLNS